MTVSFFSVEMRPSYLYTDPKYREVRFRVKDEHGEEFHLVEAVALDDNEAFLDHLFDHAKKMFKAHLFDQNRAREQALAQMVVGMRTDNR